MLLFDCVLCVVVVAAVVVIVAGNVVGVCVLIFLTWKSDSLSNTTYVDNWKCLKSENVVEKW